MDDLVLDTSWNAVSHVTRDFDALAAVAECMAVVRSRGEPIAGLIFYFTQAHDPAELAEVLSAEVGDIPTVAASVQGVTSQGHVEEDGYLLGVFAWTGRVDVTVHCIEDLPRATFEKGVDLGRAITELPNRQASFVFYDPLGGVNARSFLRGFAEVLPKHLLFGAATGGPWGKRVATYQFDGQRLLQRALVCLTVGGDMTVVSAATTGTVPAGIRMTVTQCEDNAILELDGRPALQAWHNQLDETEMMTMESMSSLALGIERGGPGEETWAVLAPFGYDAVRSAIILQSDVAVGDVVEMHRRSPAIIFERVRAMAEKLRAEVVGREVVAVLGFECGARTSPFLGLDASLAENLILQEALGTDVPWLGLLAWGEVVPVEHGAEFFNYTYPLAVLCRSRGESSLLDDSDEVHA
ncbi:MAG: hypothetical protein ACI9OJ_003647 [Myxococcota bacterium]|jgi:hypothetical protein